MSPCERDQMSTNVLRMDGKLGQNQPIEPPFAPLVRLSQRQHALHGCERCRQVIAVSSPNCGLVECQVCVLEVVRLLGSPSGPRRHVTASSCSSQSVAWPAAAGSVRTCSATAALLEIGDPLANLRPRLFDALLDPTEPVWSTAPRPAQEAQEESFYPVRDRKPVVSEGLLPAIQAVQPLVPVALGRAIGRLSLSPICSCGRDA